MSSTQPTCNSNCSDDTPLGSNGIDPALGAWRLLIGHCVKDYANGDVRPSTPTARLQQDEAGKLITPSPPPTSMAFVATCHQV
jgi:hypothetical protein